tara:strand:+ start:83 stop:1309 length:1227 start_codon:yes stop_codon:yes gene_type:complete
MNNYPSHWKISSLINLVEVKASSVDKKSREGHDQIQLCNYMDVFNNSTINNSITFMRSTASEKEIKDFKLIKGDVLLTKDSEVPEEIGMPSVLNENIDDLICGYHLYLLRIKNSILSPEYLCWTLRSNQSRQYFYQIANGSTRFGLNQGHVNKCLIPIPPLSEQKKIVEILTGIDKLIESVKDQIKKLEILKMAILNNFLNYYFEKNLDNTKSLNKITLKEFCEINPESLKESTEPKQKFRYIDLSSIKNQKIDFSIKPISFENLPSRARRKIRNDDVLLGTVRPNLKNFALIKSLSIDLICSTGFAVLRSKPNLSLPTFLYQLINSDYFGQILSSFVVGSNYPAVNQKQLEEIELPFLSLKEQKQISDILTEFDQNIDSKEKKLIRMNFLKKSLCQDLLSGSKRVKI